MLKLKLQYFGHLMQKHWLIWKVPDAGKDGKQEEKRTTEDEGDSEGQGRVVYLSPWSHKKSDLTYRLTNDSKP